ncbi:MAG: carbohydrate ABC transporter permease [Firmicutes bacterium]|nr:carbohydrate ABC transporter permease [Bacillota bacterium]MCL5040628.1 carbohydrate ABC transporter permease [Bacillota bacterium]
MKPRISWSTTVLYFILSLLAVLSLYPLVVMVLSSFRSTAEILTDPLSLPHHLDLTAYVKIWQTIKFGTYLKNSLVVSVTSVFLILALGSMAAFYLARYNFRHANVLGLYFLAGLMIPVRLAILPLFLLMRNLGLLDTHFSLILTYVASGLPFAVFILTGFFRTLPRELEDAARMDGCSELMLYYRIMLPLVRPALATVGIMNFINFWNDFFFPLIFLRSEALKTIPLGMAALFGEHETEWGLLFAGLTTSALPMVLLFLLASRQFIRGLTAGAVKG